MSGWLIGALVCLSSLVTEGEATFTEKPKAVKNGERVRITFSVSAPTDVEVAIVDVQGRVVRHLAAGLLGPNPPAPLKPGLAQDLTWDGKDDNGVAVQGAGSGTADEPNPSPAARGGETAPSPHAPNPTPQPPLSVRVRIGSLVTLDRYLGRSGQATGDAIPAIAVGPAGEVYVVLANATYGRSELRVLDRNGRYLRTIVPYPSSTPEARLADIGRLKVGDETFPVVFDAHAHAVQPLMAGMNRQGMFVHPKGHLVLASAVGTITNHGPPRYLLALDPTGGASASVRHLGPQLLKPRGMLGGTGESGATAFDGLAASPDGEWTYVTTFIDGSRFKSLRKHCVWRVRWTDAALGEPFLGKAEPGADDAHFSDPQGVATDAAGRIYVCDRGNHRVMVFDADGKLAGKFAVPDPEQIAIHRPSGAIYVVSRPPGASLKLAGTVLRKFSPWQDGRTAEVLKQDFDKKAIEVLAVDPSAGAPRLWLVVTTGWNRRVLAPVTEEAGAFVVGESVLDATSGLRYPMFVHADPPRHRLYVTEMQDGVTAVDLKTGAVTPVLRGATANEAVPAPDGSLLVTRGWQLLLARTDAAGKPLTFPSGAKSLGPWAMEKTGQVEDLWARSKGPQVGDRGHIVAPNGDLYVLLMSQYRTGRVDVYAPDGTLKKEGLIADVPHGSSGLGVDAAGNVYLGVNLRPVNGPLFPYGFAGQAPETPWVWWKQPREGVWAHPYYNTYLYHWGGVLKFSPKGGRFYIWGRGLTSVTTKPAVPEGAVEYRSGYLNLSVAVEGAEWLVPGCGPIPAAGLNWGDPSCTCNNSRLAVDGFGRIFAPDVFRFSVEMLDGAGNHIARIGRYGNADDPSPAAPSRGTAIPSPAARGGGAEREPVASDLIRFAWPAFVSVAGDDLFVCDPVNRRIAQLRVRYADTSLCPLP